MSPRYYSMFDEARRDLRWKRIRRFMVLVLFGCAVALTATVVTVLLGGDP